MKKLLMVDDSDSFVELLKLMLKSDFDVTFAKNSTEALSLFTSSKFDAVIIDMSLPGYTGYYLGNKIRKNSPNIPIAILTNYNGEVSKENAELINASFWYKPNVADSKEHLINNLNTLLKSDN